MMTTTENDETLRRNADKLFQSWRNDWNKFIEEALGVTLDPEQQAIVAAVQRNKRVSVRSGTARGKDFVAACIAVSFLYLTPRWNKRGELVENTKVALTAPTDRQVKNIMMPEISRLFNKAKARGFALPGRLTAYDIRTDNEEWFLTGFKADEHNHEAWSGFHAVHTMFVATEATGIGDDTFAAIEGNLQGDSRIMIVFNPNKTVGYAAKSQKGNRWARFCLNSLTAPNVVEKRIVIPGQVDYEWIIDKIENWCTPIDKSEVLVEMDDFEKARDKILLGVARESVYMTDEEKKATAYHEAGHTLLHYYLKYVDPLHKVTIIPHGRALGLTMSLPEKDSYTKNRSYLEDRIKICMGGYVAEDIVYGETTTGTSNDIKQATEMARRMVTEWGMSDLGFISLANDDEPLFLGREITQHKDYSEETARRIDQEIGKILDRCMDDTKRILTEHRDQLDRLTDALVEKETLDDKEIREMFGFPPVEHVTDLV